MSDETAIRREGALAVVTIDNPPVNALSASVRRGLLGCIESLRGDSSVEAVLIRCAGRTFVAGADIREFDTGVAEPTARQVFTAIEDFPRPVVAALHGTALGAGVELALACHYRCAAPDAKLGLPELTLGIIPGAGGTQRLPRLIGARRALEIILDAAPIGAEEAERIGLVDRLITGDLAAGAEAFARELIARHAPPRPTSALRPDTTGFDEAFIEQRLAGARQRMRGQRAPALAVQAVRAAIALPFDQGLEREAEIAREQVKSDEARALRHLFFAERAFAKRLRKIGMEVEVCYGFVGNRMMLDGYVREADQLLLEGATPEQVDRVVEAFGFAMGPFTMSDMGGNDVALRARETSGIRAHRPSPYNEVTDELARRGRLGQKTGAGFYRYEPGSRTPIPDPATTAIIEEVAHRFGIERRTVNDEEIEARCVYPLINEGAKILAEDSAYRPGDIDVIWTIGYGFPRFRGGPMFYADSLGLRNVYEEIGRLHARLGRYWQPAPLLKELAESGRTFTQWSSERH